MKFILNLLLLLSFFITGAQPITGVWRGKITNGSGMFATSSKVELKLIKKGDSLVGTSYYFASAGNYIRYSVRGYFDAKENTVHWQDDQFLEVRPVGKTTVGVFKDAMVCNADFNCPGNNVMKLDGNSHIGENGPVFTLHFDKVDKPVFHDEWDNVIEGYFTGMDDPAIIDSVYAITKPYQPPVTMDVAKNDKPAPAVSKPGETKSVNNAPPPATETPVAKNDKPLTSPQTLPAPKPSSTDSALAEKAKPADMAINQPARETKIIEKPVLPGITRGDTSLKPQETGKDKTIIATIPAVVKNDTAAIAKTGTPKAPPQSKPVALPAIETGKSNSQPVHDAVAKQVTAPPQKPVTQPAITGKPAATLPNGEAAGSPAVKPAEVPAGTVAKNTTQLPRPAPVVVKDPVAEQMFITRKKINQGQIPIAGDSIELNFYDNAEVDGDSISLFLNGNLLFNHVLLSTQAHTFKVATADLPNGSELTMVAENLGSIPPNTALMLAYVDGQRYSARIESTEKTSGVIKLVRR